MPFSSAEFRLAVDLRGTARDDSSSELPRLLLRDCSAGPARNDAFVTIVATASYVLGETTEGGAFVLRGAGE